MVKTASAMLPLGSAAPLFDLPNFNAHFSEVKISLETFSNSKLLLVAFWSNHCPFVKHLAGAFVAFAKEYNAKGLAVVAINSNDIDSYPDDAPEQMTLEAQKRVYGFPYLFDLTQDVAKHYHAACTPDFFLFDDSRRLIYRGQFDASRPGNGKPITGMDMRLAVDSALADIPLTGEQSPSIGCNIKWRRGNAPDYFC